MLAFKLNSIYSVKNITNGGNLCLIWNGNYAMYITKPVYAISYLHLAYGIRPSTDFMPIAECRPVAK
jgi:hypothetical protein